MKKDEIYQFIKEFAEKENCVPTIRDICSGTGLKSTSSVQYYIVALIADGRLYGRENRVPAYGLTGYTLRRNS